MLVLRDNLPNDYVHIYLSPHFDDAALSVGGTIVRQTAAGERVLVVTVCSASPREPLNAFAAHLHERWGGASDPIAVRRAEDAAAVERLGADLLWLDELDAIYRHPIYDSVDLQRILSPVRLPISPHPHEADSLVSQRGF